MKCTISEVNMAYKIEIVAETAVEASMLARMGLNMTTSAPEIYVFASEGEAINANIHVKSRRDLQSIIH